MASLSHSPSLPSQTGMRGKTDKSKGGYTINQVYIQYHSVSLGTHSKNKNYENSEHGPICGRGGSCISLKKYIFL